MASANNSPLLKFWKPRYWSTWVFYAWMRASVLLPIRWQVALGKRIGRLLHVFLITKRRVAEQNLQACFPDLSPQARAKLCREHFEAIGAAIPEMAMGWFGPEDVVRSAIEIEGADHLRAALEKGNGVILFAAHFTTLEFFHPALKTLCPRLCAMYRLQRNELMNQLMHRGRGRSFDQLFPKTNVRSMVKSLAENSVVWYAQDQSYDRKYSALVPFFNEPAMTNTATSRIAKMSGATVLPYFCKRCPDDSTYVMRIGAPLENLPSDDPVEDTRRLMSRLEAFVRTCPEQYAWIHRRFKGRPDSLPDLYTNPEQSA